MEEIGGGLQGGGNLRTEDHRTDARLANPAPSDFARHVQILGQGLGERLRMPQGPGLGTRQAGQQVADRGLLAGDRSVAGQGIGVAGHDPGTVVDDPRLIEQHGAGGIGLPGHPGVYRAAHQGGAAVHRTKEGKAYVLRSEAGATQRAKGEEMPPAAAIDGNALALEAGHRTDRRVLADHQRHGRRVEVPGAHRLERRAGSVDEEERDVAGKAYVQGPGVERLEHRCTGGERRHFQLVRQVVELAGRAQGGVAVALHIAQAQADEVGGAGGSSQQGRGQQAGKHTQGSFHGQSPGSSARSRGYPGLSVPPVRSPTRPGSRIVGGTFQRLSAALPAALQTLSFCGVWTRPQSTSR